MCHYVILKYKVKTQTKSNKKKILNYIKVIEQWFKEHKTRHKNHFWQMIRLNKITKLIISTLDRKKPYICKLINN